MLAGIELHHEPLISGLGVPGAVKIVDSQGHVRGHPADPIRPPPEPRERDELLKIADLGEEIGYVTG